MSEAGERALRLRQQILAMQVQFEAVLERAADAMVAFGRAADEFIRESEDAMTVDERVRYYELRDQDVAPLDALDAIFGDESGSPQRDDEKGGPNSNTRRSRKGA